MATTGDQIAAGFVEAIRSNKYSFNVALTAVIAFVAAGNGSWWVNGFACGMLMNTIFFWLGEYRPDKFKRLVEPADHQSDGAAKTTDQR